MGTVITAAAVPRYTNHEVPSVATCEYGELPFVVLENNACVPVPVMKNQPSIVQSPADPNLSAGESGAVIDGLEPPTANDEPPNFDCVVDKTIPPFGVNVLRPDESTIELLPLAPSKCNSATVLLDGHGVAADAKPGNVVTGVAVAKLIDGKAKPVPDAYT